MSVFIRCSLFLILITAGCSSRGYERGRYSSDVESPTVLGTPCFDAKAECGEHANCSLSEDGIAECTCIAGYEVDEEGQCITKPTCRTTCPALSTCIGDTCVCNAGYSMGDGDGCIDIDECEVNNGGCGANAVCTNQIGGIPLCTCSPGFSTAPNGACQDINECQHGNGGCGAIDRWRCINEEGGFSCECQDGFVTVEGDCIDEACTLESWTAKALEGCDELRGADLVDANLSAADLANADMRGADLTGANFDGATLHGADLGAAIMDGVHATNLQDCPAVLPIGWGCIETPYAGLILAGPGADLSDTNLSEANMLSIDLTGSMLVSTNLTSTDLVDVKLVGADLTNAIMQNTIVTGVRATYLASCPKIRPAPWSCVTVESGIHMVGPKAQLSGVNLDGANLDSVNITGADLTGASIQNASLVNSDFEDAMLADVMFDSSDMTNAIFHGADLTNASMLNTTVIGVQAVDLIGCPDKAPSQWTCQETWKSGFILYGPAVNLAYAKLTLTDFEGANLSNADLYSTHLDYADLANANLSGTDLRHADLSHAILNGADLSDADLDLADLTGADLSDAQLSGIRAIQLSGCPQTLPAAWECVQTPESGFALIGPGADLSQANLSFVDLSGFDLSGTKFNGTTLMYARAIGLEGCPSGLSETHQCVQTTHSGAVIFGPYMDLKEANFNDSELSDLNITGADLSGSTMVGTTAINLTGCPTTTPYEWACKPTLHSGNILVGPHAILNDTNLMGVNLSHMNLTGIFLKGATVSYADLTNANLSTSKLHDADFQYSDLTGANFFNAILTNANFDWANLTNVHWQITYCGDITTSNGNGGTCCGHLAGSTPAVGCD
jgi:uncharacterized protein YjbI with pentapeptide repeats